MCLRLLDANCNRAQEALRVVEDILRFEYDSPAAVELKKIRHEFSVICLNIRKSIDGLWQSRSVSSDIMKADPSGAYEQVQDALYSNFQRIKEALRVIEEALRILGREEYASRVSELRFDVYEVEAKTFQIKNER